MDCSRGEYRGWGLYGCYAECYLDYVGSCPLLLGCGTGVWYCRCGELTESEPVSGSEGCGKLRNAELVEFWAVGYRYSPGTTIPGCLTGLLRYERALVYLDGLTDISSDARAEFRDEETAESKRGDLEGGVESVPSLASH